MSDQQPPTDTPVNRPTFPRASRLEAFKAFIGDLARPFAIISTSFGATFATITLALRKGIELNAAGVFIGAVFAGVVGLYVGKAVEEANKVKHTSAAQAQVEVAKATGNTP